ncbi:RNA polymerase sigma factor [Marinobacter pelagius]|uniref:RNA polymerase sigma factor n=1 Tax=Marinobacter sp. C7 TaxID=2951363 RepID=UPI001EF07E29|nr:RNA polymerase sigma factor [Marinobacter sp. C7]MCG7200201.1 RNA polymerase sigma factor [Marinobacter sp. C7]
MANDPLALGQLYQQQSRRVLATLIRLLGDFVLAEEAMQEAFAAALRQWPEDGVPDNPTAWLIRAGQRRGIDQIRRKQTARQHSQLLAYEEGVTPEPDEQTIADDQLRLLFTCCHPALSMDARVALTLREMCGLSTEQVANALLQKPVTLAQRIVRAKKKIRAARIPYEIPGAKELPQRLPAVLRVVYLVFNEGYSRSDGDSVVDASLATEAIRLAEELGGLLPQGEVFGLIALMRLHHSRRHARQDAQGELVTLEDQDRTCWDQHDIRQGLQYLELALANTPTGPYTLQASIAAVHAQALRADATDWARIVRLYDALYRQQPSPIIALNRAVAVAMRDTPADGLQLLDALINEKAILNYHLFHAAKADLHRRADEPKAAAMAYKRAIELTSQGPEQRFLQRRLAKLGPTI